MAKFNYCGDCFIPDCQSGCKAEAVRDASYADVPKEEAPFNVQRQDVQQKIPRPRGSEKFHDLLKEIGDLHDKKQQDYGQANDPFANVRGASDYGVAPWVGAMIRATDKVRRLMKYATSGKLSNESARDSFLDLAVYALIALLLWEETNG